MDPDDKRGSGLMRLLVVSSKTGPDYLADLFFCELISSGHYEIAANYVPPYYFSDFPDATQLYGRGYTVFAKLATSLRRTVHIASEEEIRSNISEKHYDKIIYTSVWRCNEYLNDTLDKYAKGDIIVLDGEDTTTVANIAIKTTYFKRELTKPYSNICLPIGFLYPSYSTPPLDWREPNKSQILAPCVPGYTNSYIFNTEEEYYRQYSKSLFSLTVKKAGWDCMRHYEIIKAGSIPFFPDIIEKPDETMSTYPIGLQTEANCLLLKLISDPASTMRLLDKVSRVSKNFLSWLNESGHTVLYRNILA